MITLSLIWYCCGPGTEALNFEIIFYSENFSADPILVPILDKLLLSLIYAVTPEKFSGESNPYYLDVNFEKDDPIPFRIIELLTLYVPGPGKSIL